MIKINIKFGQTAEESLEVDPMSTVLELKEKLVTKFNIPSAQQRVIFAGRILKDAQTLDSYGLNKDGLTVHLVKGAATTSATPTTTNQSPTQQTPTQTMNQQASLNNGMFGMPNIGGSGNNGQPLSMQQMMRQMQSNPEYTRQMMDNPLVQSMMNNPELMRTMMMSNPQMRQLVEANPELSHVLNDPQLLRQTMEMARNPELMREAMRNTDRAMSNIEALPGGYTALQRFFTDVQEPLMDAVINNHPNTDANSNNNNTANNNNSNASGIPNIQPLPNPWAPNTPSAGSTTGTRVSSNQTTSPQPTQQSSRTTPNDLLGMMGGMGGMGEEAVPDPQQVMQMMQNPMMQQMMQHMTQNPQVMTQMMEMSPWGRQMLQDPMMRQMLQDPSFLQAISNPQVVQSALQMQQSLGGLGGLGALGGLGGLPPFPGIPSTQQPGATNQQTPIGVPLGQAPSSMPAPEVRFASQLRQLEEMGFTNTAQNITALTATQGNVQFAIERLLSGNH